MRVRVYEIENDRSGIFKGGIFKEELYLEMYKEKTHSKGLIERFAFE